MYWEDTLERVKRVLKLGTGEDEEGEGEEEEGEEGDGGGGGGGGGGGEGGGGEGGGGGGGGGGDAGFLAGALGVEGGQKKLSMAEQLAQLEDEVGEGR